MLQEQVFEVSDASSDKHFKTTFLPRKHQRVSSSTQKTMLEELAQVTSQALVNSQQGE